MLNRFKPYVRKSAISKIVNTKNLEVTDITGSLLNIEIPSEQNFLAGSKRFVKSTIVNAKQSQPNDLTGSLISITEPIKLENTYTKANNNINVVNTDRITQEFRSNILKYSARSIEKQITSFNSQTNQLFISGTIIDYGTESVSDKDFEIYYNGVLIPDIFMVKQIDNDIVITLTEEHIEYESLQLSEIKVIGKFK